MGRCQHQHPYYTYTSSSLRIPGRLLSNLWAIGQWVYALYCPIMFDHLCRVPRKNTTPNSGDADSHTHAFNRRYYAVDCWHGYDLDPSPSMNIFDNYLFIDCDAFAVWDLLFSRHLIQTF